MGDHYLHQSETVQSALDRIIPFVKSAAGKNEINHSGLRKKVMQNGGQMRKMKDKIKKLESYLSEEQSRLEKEMKENFKKVREMGEDQELQHQSQIDTQRDVIIYLQKIKLPFHSEDLCPDEGAIEMNKLPESQQTCTIGRCKPKKYTDITTNKDDEQCRECDTINHTIDEVRNESNISDTTTSCGDEMTNNNCNEKNEQNLPNSMDISDCHENNCINSTQSEHSLNNYNGNTMLQVQDNGASTSKQESNFDSMNNNSVQTDSQNDQSEKDAEVHNNMNNNEHNDCQTISNLMKKPWKQRKQESNLLKFTESCQSEGYRVKNVDHDTCIAVLEKGGKESQVTLLCEQCQKKRKGIDTINYAPVYAAIKSKDQCHIG